MIVYGNKDGRQVVTRRMSVYVSSMTIAANNVDTGVGDCDTASALNRPNSLEVANSQL